MAGNKIGELFFEFRTKGAEVMRSTLRKIKGDADSVGGSFDKSLGRIGQRFEDATSGARKFQGAISGVLGIIGAVTAAAFAAGKAIFELAENLRSGSDKAKEFIDALGDGRFRDVTKEAEALRDRIQEISNQLGADGIAADIDRLLSGGAGRLQEERDALVARLQVLNQFEQGQAQRRLDQFEKEEAEKARIEKERIDKIASEERFRIELAGRLYREQLRENERAARETAQRIAQANADAIRDAANQASQAIESAINSQSGTFTRLEDLVNTIAQRLDRIERRQR